MAISETNKKMVVIVCEGWNLEGELPVRFGISQVMTHTCLTNASLHRPLITSTK